LLLLKGSVRVCAVVPSQGEIAEAVEPALLNRPPLWPEHFLPLSTQLLVLRQDVLDRVARSVGGLFCAMVLEPVQQVVTRTHAVDVACREVVGKFFVFWETVDFTLTAERDLEIQ